MKIFKRSYICFLIKSSNQHGIHSPYVFDYLTKGIYKQKRRWRLKANRDTFPKWTIEYFQPKSVFIYGSDVHLDFCEKNKICYNTSEVVDFIWVKDNLLFSKELIDRLFKQMHNDSVLLLSKSKNNTLWEEIVEDSRFVVTMDFYFYGVASIRKEQLKQHFILRI